MLIRSAATVRVAVRSSPLSLSAKLTTTSETRLEAELDAGVTVTQSAPPERVTVQGELELTLKVILSGREAGTE